jgi:hypothetical protein
MFPPKQHPPYQPRQLRSALQEDGDRAERAAHQAPSRGPEKTVVLTAVSIIVGAPVIGRRPWLGRARAALRTFGAFVRSQPRWRPW